jgi:hypothetical protein
LYAFRVAHSRTLFILENCVSIVSFLQSKPNSHKAFITVVLTHDVFSESTAAGKGSGKQGVLREASPSGLERKEEAMNRVANSMTKTFVASKERHDKRKEKMQVGRNTTTYYAGLCSLPKSADGNTARVLMNKKIRTNNAHMKEITSWFDDNLSPSNTP